MKKIMLSLLMAAALCACSNSDGADNSKTNQTKTAPQTQNDSMAVNNSTIDDFMGYLKSQGVEYMDEQPIEDMNITAHEGRSFSIDGNTGYLYRVDTSDDTMKKLLSSARDNGVLDATQNGVQKSYAAHVNGDYLFLYDKEANMESILKVFPSFNPNAPQTSNTVNPGVSSTAPVGE